MSSIDSEKYAALFDFQKSQYVSALERYRRLDEKSAKYLGMLTFGFGAYVVLVKSAVERVIPIECGLDVLVVFSIGLTLLAFVCAWSHIYRSLGLSDVLVMQASSSQVELFKKNSLDEVRLAYANQYSILFDEINRKHEDKSRLLRLAYADAGLAAGAVFVSSCLIFISYAWSA
ncbi:hypothetical protein [Stenotrophomonas sp. PSU_St99]